GAWCVGFIRAVEPPPWAAEVLALVGLVLSLYAVVSFSAATPFPGSWALVPCMGAVLLIISGDRAHNGVGRLLTHPLAVRLGVMSYALYLVHWPLVVLTRLWSFRPLGVEERLWLGVASGVGAFVLHMGVERPLRMVGSEPPRVSHSTLAVGALMLTAALAMLSAHATWDGWRWRVGEHREVNVEEALRARFGAPWGARWRVPGVPGHRTGVRDAEPPRILVVGDSHALYASQGLGWWGAHHGQAIQVWAVPGCPPLFGAHLRTEGQRSAGPSERACAKQNVRWRSHIATHPYDVVVLMARWHHFTERASPGSKARFLVDEADRHPPSFQRSRHLLAQRLEETVVEIREAGPKVLLIAQPPLSGAPVVALADCTQVPPWLISSEAIRRRCSNAGLGSRQKGFHIAQERSQFTDATLVAIAARHGQAVEAVVAFDHFCDRAQERCNLWLDGIGLYTDDNHLSSYGSLVFAQAYGPPLLQLLHLDGDPSQP
ncbi:MAG: acyltransferase family protein, partial [Myxococcota bacterium]